MTQIHLIWENIKDKTDQGQVTVSLPITIGRSSDNDIVLTYKKAGVSRKHVQLIHHDGEIVLIDLESTNGTFVNGRKILEAPITNGTHFTIGTYQFIFNQQIRCPDEDCQKLVAHHLKTCPWCGHFLADAQTRFVLPA